MSQVKVSGNASGTGILTIAAPNTNTNYTLTLPANTGTILTSATTTGFPAGSVLQMVSSTSNTTITASGTRQTLLTVSITPSSASNKILLMYSGQAVAISGGSNAYWDLVLKRVTTSTDLVYTFGGFGSTAGSVGDSSAITYVDSPATTSSVSYSVGLNRGSSGTTNATTDGQQYTLIAMEIAA